MTGKFGIALNGYEVSIQHFPYRKKPCLAITLPGSNACYKVASFNDEETADWFLGEMAKMFGKAETPSNEIIEQQSEKIMKELKDGADNDC